MSGGAIIRCRLCQDQIQSMHVHDFVRCSCGEIFIDGGSFYTRIGWPRGNRDEYIEIIEENKNEI